MAMSYVLENEAQLRAAIRSDESEHLEFKSATNSFPSEDLFKYCVALSNEGGGCLVLGVSDKTPRTVVGTSCFPDSNAIKKRLLDTLKFRIDVVEFKLAEGRVLVFVCPGRPIGTVRNLEGRYYMRSGDALVPMTPEVLQRMLSEAVPDFSQTVCGGASIDDLSSEAIAEFRNRWARKSGNAQLLHVTTEQLLSDAHLIEGDRVTQAGMILLAKADSLTRLLPQAELIFEYRNSEASIEHQDRVEYRAGFFVWSNDVWQRINARNEKHSYRDGMFRYEVAAFNEDVVREALLNAVTHREYRDGRSIFVRQFPSRLEITSPGGFPNGISEENIIYRQHPRNRRIAEALQYCGLVERSGQGADRMYRVCIQEGKSRPDYSRSDDFQVVLTLNGQVRDPRFVGYLERLANEKGMSLTLDDFLILDRVREGDDIPPELKGRVTTLLEQGVIERAGRGRGVHYILSHGLYQHVGEGGTYTRRKGLDDDQNQELLIKHISHCGSRGATMHEFGQVLPSKTRPQLAALLRRLKEQGRIRVEGKTRGARWYLVSGTQ